MSTTLRIILPAMLAWVISYTSACVAVRNIKSKPIRCAANSEVLISAPEEYSVWELDCEDSFRVVTLD